MWPRASTTWWVMVIKAHVRQSCSWIRFLDQLSTPSWVGQTGGGVCVPPAHPRHSLVFQKTLTPSRAERGPGRRFISGQYHRDKAHLA